VTLLDHGALEPGADGLAQVQLDGPLVALPGDRFILRGFELQRHHGTTLGGGVVIRTLGTRLRRGTPEAVALLARNEQLAEQGTPAALDERVALEVERAGARGIERAALQMRLAPAPRVVDAALQRLQGARRVVRYDKERGALIGQGALAELKAAALAAIAAFHASQPLDAGMPREALRAQVAEDPRLLHVVVDALAQEQAIVVERELVRLPSHDARRTRAASGLEPMAERVVRLYAEAALQPPRVAEAAAALKAEPREIEQALELLARGGSILRIKDLCFHRPAIDGLRERLVAHLRDKGQITPQEWKDLVGATRKFTIPLAEHFDAEKVTLRVGDLRKLRG
jgi:selenocysteine-specific elongation factor